MRFSKVTSAVLFLFLTQMSVFAGELKYSPATIVTVETKINTRVLYYVVNTPITKDEPYFEVSVQLNNTVFLGRHIPKHANETLPEEWTAGAKVDCRVDGRHLFLKRPSGIDMDFAVVKHTPASTGEMNPQH